MSASDKKQLRKELQNEMLTARQREEQAEAKKLKAYTVTFIAIMVAVFVIAIGSLIFNGVESSGVYQRNTIAATVNGEELNAVELNYYYSDAVSELYAQAYEQYSYYYELFFDAMGLDVTKPLNEQNNPETNDTWANYFVNAGLDNAKRDYTLEKLAKENNFELTGEALDALNTQLTNMDSNAKLNGFSSADNYLRAVYGVGSDMESYKTYLTRMALADAYYQDHYDALTYDEAKIEEHAKDKVNNYNAYDYSYVYVSYTDFLNDAEEDEEGTTTYTEEQKSAARAEAKKMADRLYALGNLDDIRDEVGKIEEVDLEINDYTNDLHTSINKPIAEWLAGADRKAGDVALLENTSVAEEGEEPTVNGYYVVCFTKRNDNTAKMSNVRHLLVQFEGGKEDEISGEMVYTTEEKEAAKAEAEALLQQWKDGAATEESFAELVKEKTDDTGSKETGGLYEDINPGSQYVPNFLSWSINPARQAGDVEIVETEYGYHIMYFTGYSEQSYRDSLITEELKAADMETWYDGIMETATASALDLSKTKLDLVISG